jgi:hypothetical protein
VRRALLAIGLLVGTVVIAVGAIDLLVFQDDEVATLVTVTPAGEAYETQIWVVEGADLGGAEGELWLRAHSREADWLARLIAIPAVEISRDGRTRSFEAAAVLDQSGARDRVNEAMARKYGVADRMVAWLASPETSVPVRLVPDASRQARRKSAGTDEPTHP